MLEVLFGLRAKISKKLELRKYRREILKIANICKDEEIQEVAAYLKSHPAKVLNYLFTEDVERKMIDVLHDKDGFPYILRSDKKIFFQPPGLIKKLVHITEHYLKSNMSIPHICI